MFGQAFNSGFFKAPCFTDTTDIFKDNSGIALYTLDYDASDAGGASGKFGEAAIFNGSSSYINLGTGSSGLSGLLNQKVSQSVSFWMNTSYTGISGNSVIYSVYAGGGISLNIYYFTNGTLHFLTRYTNSNTTFTTTQTFNDSQWHHISVTIDVPNLERKIYIDNSLVSTQALSSNAYGGSGTTGVALGTNGNFNTQYYKGNLDQVRIFNTALTSSQVTQLYQENNSTVGTHLFGCIANYNLDGSAKESMGTTAYDGAETDITYRYDGTPTAVDFGVGGKSNYSARFNGSSSNIELPNSSLGITDSSNFSISYWFNTNSTTQDNQSVIWANASNAGARFGSGINSATQGGDTSIYFGMPINGSFTYINSGTSAFTANTWVHVVCVKSSTTGMSLYVDNVLKATNTGATGSGSATATGKNTIGSYYTGGPHGSFFNGSIDQVRIFNKALNSTEISKLYGNGAGEIACKYKATTTDVNYPVANTAYYKLDNDATDEVGSYDGTETNIEYTFGRFGQAAVFNSSKLTNMPFIAANSSYSISLWFKTSSSARQSIIASNSSSHSIALNINNGQLAIHETDVGDSDTFTGTWNDGNWHHLVMVNKSAIWVDGVSRGTTTQDLFENEKLEFGYWEHSGPIYYFNGSLDQIRILSTALSSSQVTELYNEKPETDTSTFKTVLYEGNGGTQYISNVGMDLETSGGLVWLKGRDSARDHRLFDSVRGATKGLYSNLTNAEFTESGVDSFEDNGFFLGSVAGVNANNESFVGWVFKGGGEAVPNTNGTGITSSVSANQDAGFSIVSYTGSGNASHTVGHGLDNKPELIILKRTSSAMSWFITSSQLGNNEYLTFTTGAKTTDAGSSGVPSSVNNNNDTTFGFRSGSSSVDNVNQSGGTFIAYCFHSVGGYSKIGSYTGNGSSTGPNVTTGFEPKFIMIKRTDTSGYGWYMMDSARGMDGTTGKFLFADTSASEGTLGAGGLQPNSTGFQITDAGAGFNALNGTYIYMAFA